MIKYLILSLALVASAVSAGGNTITTNNYYNSDSPPPVVDQDTGVNSTGVSSTGVNSIFDKYTAMGAAADYCIFDYASGWQGCGSTGWSNGEQAINAMFATRIDTWMIKVGVQTDIDLDEYQGGVGARFHF